MLRESTGPILQQNTASIAKKLFISTPGTARDQSYCASLRQLIRLLHPRTQWKESFNNLFLCSSPTTGLTSTAHTTAPGQNPRDTLHPGPSSEATGAELMHTQASCPTGPSAVPSWLRQLFRAGGALWDHNGHWGSKGSPLHLFLPFMAVMLRHSYTMSPQQ